ncbi:MAG: S8 family serine peptidase [Nitrospirota bacterium]
MDVTALTKGDVVFPKLGIAVVSGQPDQIQLVGVESADPVLSIEAERIVYATNYPPILNPAYEAERRVGPEYLQGYRDAVNHLANSFLASDEHGVAERRGAAIDTRRETWGLYATQVFKSSYGGRGIKMAVLDTGLDLDHPDFAGRQIHAESFISGETADDGNGHGTHTIGTSCGAKKPHAGPRYGVAYEAEIYAGKVLSNGGSGDDSGILAGIEWALSNRCQIISMSLGAPANVGDSYSQAYEQAARRALAAGTLIVAAAGNESQRPERVEPVGHPANCPSIMAVAALDRTNNIAYFSCGGLASDGGQVDIAGPGVAVYSSWPLSRQYKVENGTSMATPHVAGVAALYAEAQRLRGSDLWNALTRTAKRLRLSSQDVGAGLVQAP